MTKDEARAILEREHFCTIHLRRMEVVPPHPMQNVCAGVNFVCSECRAELNKVRDEELHQAMEILRGRQ